ncbi:Fc.00g036640.m01.CDS01 [Cosmosporella sp. VM-42]
MEQLKCQRVAKPTRPGSTQDWEDRRAIITELYWNEDKGLQEVIKIMKVAHGFSATPRQYKTQFSRWKIEKNVKTHEMMAIVHIQDRRRDIEDKDTLFKVRGRPVEQEKIDRFAKRQKRSTTPDPALNARSSGDTPSDIEYFTPRSQDMPTTSTLLPNTPHTQPKSNPIVPCNIHEPNPLLHYSLDSLDLSTPQLTPSDGPSPTNTLIPPSPLQLPSYRAASPRDVVMETTHDETRVYPHFEVQERPERDTTFKLLRQDVKSALTQGTQRSDNRLQNPEVGLHSHNTGGQRHIGHEGARPAIICQDSIEPAVVHRRGKCLLCRFLGLKCSSTGTCDTCINMARNLKLNPQIEMLRFSECIRTRMDEINIFDSMPGANDPMTSVKGVSRLLDALRLDFEVDWDIDILFKDTMSWLMTHQQPRFSKVGVFCTTNCAVLMRDFVPDDILVCFRVMLLATSMAYCRSDDHDPASANFGQKLNRLSALAGSRLLSRLETYLNSESLLQQSTVRSQDANAKFLKANFLLVLGTIIGITYTKHPGTSPEFPILDVVTGTSRSSTLWNAMKEHVCLMLAHHLIFIGARLGVILPFANERLLLYRSAQAWDKPGHFTWMLDPSHFKAMVQDDGDWGNLAVCERDEEFLHELSCSRGSDLSRAPPSTEGQTTLAKGPIQPLQQCLNRQIQTRSEKAQASLSKVARPEAVPEIKESAMKGSKLHWPYGRACSGAMGSWTSLLVAYLLGGITFIPLLIAAIFAYAYYSLPRRDDFEPQRKHDADDIVQHGDDTELLEAAKKPRKSSRDEVKARANHDLNVAAGYFAVCREYTPMGINAKPIERPTPVGSTTVASPSPSVYQTMYRSIFERKPVAGPLDNGNSTSQRPKKAGNVFYVVLRHGHLMLFDDDEQVEVRHVISLAHHEISIYSGGDKTPEGELFIKRNALCLSRKQDGPELARDSQISKPFFLFSENCSAKEDFYFALLKNQEQTFSVDKKAPSPLHFDVKAIISLVQKLHSTEENIHWRWLNALLGRVFLGVYKTRDLENFIREKLTKKISRVKRPAFLTNITIRGIDPGEAAPYFSNLKLKDLTVEGECVVEADVKYTGNARIEVAATAKIDLGTRFKAREVNLVLAVVLKRADGHMLFKVKPPPSNRVWFAFQTMPKMEMAIEPIVSSRQITYTVILRQIENRIKEVMAETMVLPFWDDLPFFKTEHKMWRGGIFEGDDATVSSGDVETTIAKEGDVGTVDRLEESPDLVAQTRPMEKSHTIPVMESQSTASGLFGRRLGRSANNTGAAGSSTSVESREPSSQTPRSPTVTKPTTDPVVGTDAAHAEIFKPSSPPDQATNYMTALQSRSQDFSPRQTPSTSPLKPSSMTQASSRSASPSKADEDNSAHGDMDATPIAQGRRNTASSAGSASISDEKGSTSSGHSIKESIKSQTGSLGRNFFIRRDDSDVSLSAASANSESSHKRNTLAAVTNAAVQARQWGWNAIQRQREARRHGEHANDVDLSQPMGRGQPLPPPGTPLPGPTNGTTRIAPIPVPARKPVPPPHPPQHPSTDSPEPHQEHRSAPPPPLPYRRRRGQSYDHGEESVQNLLVVAAPDDSQPTTPVTEDSSTHMTPWVEETSQEETPHDSETSREPSDLTKGTSIGKDELDSGSPLEATPAASAVDDDDDDYSGWLDNDVLSDVETKENIPDAIPQEVK